MVNSISPNLFDKAINNTPRNRLWMFSSVIPGAVPLNNSAKAPPTASCGPEIGTVSNRVPKARATPAASSKDSGEVNRDGNITQRTF